MAKKSKMKSALVRWIEQDLETPSNQPIVDENPPQSAIFAGTIVTESKQQDLKKKKQSKKITR